MAAHVAPEGVVEPCRRMHTANAVMGRYYVMAGRLLPAHADVHDDGIVIGEG